MNEHSAGDNKNFKIKYFRLRPHSQENSLNMHVQCMYICNFFENESILQKHISTFFTYFR